jgi:transcriptional regulator of acetoin/glycerol metabolism
VLNYSWPGNVRELRSAIEYAVIRCRGTVIPAADLPPELHEDVPFPFRPADMPLDEKQHLLAALEQARGNRTVAARLLGMSRATFYRRLTSFGIPRSS